MSTAIVLPKDADLFVFAIDAAMSEADALLANAVDLARALGVEAVDTTRAEVFAAEALVGIGVSGYLSEGQGASADALLPDEPMLDALTGPVLLLMPGALRADVRALDVAAPLRHVGSYPLERAAPARAALRTPSAEGLVTGAPPPLDRKKADRKASGYVALAALVFLFVVVAMMVWIA